jgi:hypothetical protein
MARIRNSFVALAALLLLASPAFAAGGTWFVSAVSGSNTNACTSWSVPCQTVAGALSLATTATCTIASPCTIAADAAGTYTASGAVSWTFPAGPTALISSTNPGSGTTISQSAGAAEAVGSSNATFTVNCANGSQALIVGMTISGTSGGSSNAVDFISSGTQCTVNWEGGEVSLLGTNNSDTVNMGNGGTNSYPLRTRFVNTTFAAGSRVGTYFSISGGYFEFVNPTFSFTGGSTPQYLFGVSSNIQPTTSTLIVRDGDISGFNSSSGYLFNGNGTLSWQAEALLKNLKIGSNVVGLASSTALQGGGGSITLRNVDSANTLYTFEYLNPRGTVTVDPTNYLSAGKQFNGSHYGYKIVTTANASEVDPFCVPVAAEVWNTDTSSQTLKIEFAQNSAATALTDQQIWARLDYPNSTSYPSYSSISDRNAAPITGTPNNQPTSSATWTGLTSPTTQYLSLPASGGFTAAANGTLQAQLCVGDPSTTVWFNPDLTQ